ncbi:MAG: nucleotide pyrophosphohydrolase [Erysipelotrichaceae bacterium]|nr:nucleotide pyrophosphohydrolase [Erysipelotrichaceae bacterium]
MKNLIKRLNKFNLDRDWEQFHTPENLSKSIVIEAAELLENFQWDNDYNIEHIKDELADIFLYTIMMAERMEIDLFEIANDKIDRNEKRYEVNKSKGNSKKYTEL